MYSVHSDDIQPNQLASEISLKVSDKERGRPICGFWIRILALLIDCIFLGIIGIILGFLFSEQFTRMGVYGRLVGFIIVLAYFGSLNSRFGKGQSLGKRITRIRVVNQNGECISFKSSLFRITILALPFFLNNLPISILILPVFVVIGLIVFGVGVGIVYFYIFNSKTRQSLHDLVCKTYVVKERAAGPVTVGYVASLHYIIFAILISISTFSCIYGRVKAERAFPEIFIIQKQLYKIKNVSSASIFAGKRFGSGGNYQYIRASVIYKEKPVSFEPEARKIVKIIFSNYSEAKSKDFIEVELIYGYDISIARGYQFYYISRSPSEWETILK